MNKQILFLSAGLIILMGACSSAPRVTRTDANAQTYLSGYWENADINEACEALINKALNASGIDTYIKNFAADHKGEAPTVVVGKFKNSSDEHIDTAIISSLMRTALINNGKLAFVEGGEALAEIRAERDDQQYNASEETAAGLGKEAGPNLMLQGEVDCSFSRAGNITTRRYFVKASLTNIETRRILWEDSYNEIAKEIKQPKVKF
jgi:PBP1b-binding outer membrane lipoprotein LpoB